MEKVNNKNSKNPHQQPPQQSEKVVQPPMIDPKLIQNAHHGGGIKEEALEKQELTVSIKYSSTQETGVGGGIVGVPKNRLGGGAKAQ